MQKMGLVRGVIFRNGLDTDELMGLPLMEIAGNERILIENHKGIIAYNCCEVCIRVQYGTATVYGQQLYFAEISKDRLVIVGKICDISLRSGGK